MENTDWRNLILSIGKVNIRKLSPFECARTIQKAINSGFSRQEIAERCLLDGSGMIGKILGLLKLPKEYWYLIDWDRAGAGKPPISMTAAQKCAHLSKEHQKIILDTRLKYGINKTEIDFLKQRLSRSGQKPEECVREIINRRNGPQTLFGIILGTLSKEAQKCFKTHTQYEQEKVMTEFLKHEFDSTINKYIKLKASKEQFSLIIEGEKLFNNLSKQKTNIEKKINGFICQTK